VDNQGFYLDFEGGLDGERMIFSRKGTSQEGKPRMSRMVFLNIARVSLAWRWEKSEDGGKELATDAADQLREEKERDPSSRPLRSPRSARSSVPRPK
jgi:hypothetical protein